MNDRMSLADLVAGLRTELDTARNQAAQKGVSFEVGPIELEVTVEAQKTAGAKAGVNFWVVTTEGGGELTTKKTQRIRLTLQPGDGENGNKPVRISGDELPNER
ncbi:trypco2 family protein [Pseudarthrobacter phenanthrenivorans]|uniref:trypco2 family protein n=1 Tax=Pseudarthrobacter phenanthrenivorans TaxID=361575 RepID=UPI002F35C827